MCFARNKGGVAAVPGLALPRIPAEPQLFGARLLVLQLLVNPLRVVCAEPSAYWAWGGNQSGMRRPCDGVGSGYGDG